MSDLIGYAVAWKSTAGNTHLTDPVVSRDEITAALNASSRAWPQHDNFIVEIRAVPEMREVTNV